MATYQITVNEKAALGKSLVNLLKSVPQVVSFDVPKKKEEKKVGSITNSKALLMMYD